jgi:hypothetical protein
MPLRPTCAVYQCVLSGQLLDCYLADMSIPLKSLNPGRISTLLLIFICLTLPGVANAGTYWVSPNGTASWANCSGSTPLSATAACSVSTANSNAAAGDMVYLRAGSYSTRLAPANSGTGPANRITFIAYTGETVTFSGGNPDFWLAGVRYIRVSGMTFSDNGNVLWARVDNGASHNEVDHNTFINTGGGYDAGSFYMTGAYSGAWVTYNWIHDNTFTLSGSASGSGGSGCTDGGGDEFIVGSYNPSNTTEADNYNTIENNVFSHGPHSNINAYGHYNVIRNNVLHNEPWSSGCTSYTNPSVFSSGNPNYTAYDGLYGHRDMQISDGYNTHATYVLLEGNRIGFAGVNQTNDGADNVSLAAPQNIVRYNFIYASMNPGLMFKYAWGQSGGDGDGGTYNRVYNNTIYQSGYGYPWASTYGAPGCTLSTCPWTMAAIATYDTGATGSAQGNVMKNNIFYQSTRYTKSGFDVANHTTNVWGDFASGNVTSNWCSGAQTGGDNGGCSASGNPLFNNPDLSNPSSTTLPDLSLQSTSSAIDGGTYLTTASNSGTNSTTLNVADALYFQDGTWGSDLAQASAGLGGTMQADWIAIGTVSNSVQISSVSYGTYSNPAGTITLASPMTWNNGAPIWLYKKSDGTQVLYGKAPDYGASEYNGGTGTVAPPTGLQAIVN